ncbi:MAG: ATP-grasp domain-containing protein [Steroidobacteraceae bacterium]
MNRRRNVLVFPCGSEIGLELHRALAYSTHFQAIGASSVDDHGRFAYDQYQGGLPFVGPDLLAPLTTLLRQHEIDLLVPAHDSAVLLFAEWAAAGRLGDTRLVGSPLETCRIARSKVATYDWLGSVVAVPARHAPDEPPLRFPVFLKPDVGQGSRGTHLAHDEAELRFHLDRDPSLLFCEHLPGPEFTIDCFTDRHGNLRFVGARERRRVAGGISVHSIEAEDPRFGEIAEAIHSSLTFRGQWFFQLKERVDGELVLLEIAPRCSGASGFYRIRGVNLPLLSLHDALDRDVSVQANPCRLEMDRALASRHRLDFAFDEVYVDLDDALLWDGGVNHRLVAVLYRFRNEGKRLHLLTRHGDRHADSAIEALEAKALSPSLFDTIVEVGESEPKAERITSGEAIFIDDSFAERHAVLKAKGIPVFDINQAIEIFGDFH